MKDYLPFANLCPNHLYQLPPDQPLLPDRVAAGASENLMANHTIIRAKPTPPEYLERIGKITASFAMLEQIVAFFCWSMISDDAVVGQIVTAELSFKNLLSMVSSLYRHVRTNETKIAELDNLLKRALQVAEKRNMICHSIWGEGKTPNSITRIKTTARVAKGLRRQHSVMR